MRRKDETALSVEARSYLTYIRLSLEEEKQREQREEDTQLDVNHSLSHR